MSKSYAECYELPKLTSYDAAHNLWTATNRRKLWNNTYLEKIKGGYAVLLYRTYVVRYYPNRIVVANGGHYTNTTIKRLSAFTPANFLTAQDGLWHLQYQGSDFIFQDGLTLKDDGVWFNGKPARPAEYYMKRAKQIVKDKIKLRAVVDAYAASFMDKKLSRHKEKMSEKRLRHYIHRGISHVNVLNSIALMYRSDTPLCNYLFKLVNDGKAPEAMPYLPVWLPTIYQNIRKFCLDYLRLERCQWQCEINLPKWNRASRRR